MKIGEWQQETIAPQRANERKKAHIDSCIVGVVNPNFKFWLGYNPNLNLAIVNIVDISVNIMPVCLRAVVGIHAAKEEGRWAK